jgi:carbonic anhydrase
MSVTDELVANNRSFAKGFVFEGMPTAPQRQLTIVACMDSRLDVFAALGLGIGSAHVIRNAGGVITEDMLRSLTISQRKLGTREIVLVHHTKCGLETFTDEEFLGEIEQDSGERPPWSPRAFDDVERSVRDSLAAIHACAYLPHRDAVRGFVYDVDTGLLTEVS